MIETKAEASKELEKALRELEQAEQETVEMPPMSSWGLWFIRNTVLL
ncbi:MAG: hypothetical protein HFH68_13105 [Lachnospiraceae bacterium]|nr:hypothetical protein [Lachnospiraceae bacterium]